MGSIKEAIERVKRPLTNALLAVVVLCLLAAFVMQGKYVSHPLSPDPTSGRTFPLAIKWHHDVYLTAEEYAPFQWMIWIGGSCGALLLLVHIASAVLPGGRK